MSEVIRKAVVELELRLKKDGLGSQDISAVTKAFEQQAAAIKNIETQTQAARRSTQEYARASSSAMRELAGIRGLSAETRAEMARQIAAQDAPAAGGIASNPSMLGREYRRLRAEVEGAIEDQERFGRRSEASFVQAGRGALQYTRGLSMLAIVGGETTQKMLQGLIAIEGASQMVMGGANLAKFSEKLNMVGKAAVGMGVAVGTGVAALSVAGAQFEHETRRLEELEKRYSKLRETSRELARTIESVGMKGQTETIEGTQTAATREAERQSQLNEIRRRRPELQARIADSAVNRATREAERVRFQRRSDAYDRDHSTLEGVIDTIGRTFGFPSAGQTYKDNAARAGRSAAAATQEEIGFSGTLLSGYERERDILQKQRDDAIAQEKQRQAAQIDNIHRQMNPASPNDKAAVALATAQFNADQFRLREQAETTGLIPSGFAYGRSLEQQQGWQISAGSQSIIEQIKRDSDASLKAIGTIITNQRVQLEKLKSDLAAANPQ